MNDDRKAQILALLTDNARMPVQEIADRIGVSRPTVRSLMNELEDEGVIKGYTIVIDPVQLSPGKRLMLDLRLDGNVCGTVYAAFQGLPEITSIWSLASTNVDMRIELEGQNIERLEKIRDEVANHKHVVSVVSSPVLKTWFSRRSHIAERCPETHKIIRIGNAQPDLQLRCV